MNKNEARIVKLEGRFGSGESPRFTIRFVAATSELNPDWASGGGHLGGGMILIRRRAGEDAVTFEARARQRFPEGTIYIGADPEPEVAST